MTRKIKGLGLAFVAIAAMSMAATSAAQASELHATTAANSVSIVGQQTKQHAFVTTAGQVKCTSATFEATVTEQGQTPQLTTTELTVTPTYTGCTAFGLAATVTMNGCKYTITNKSGAGVTTDDTAYVDITGCTAGKAIEVKNATCTMTVGEQHNLGILSFTNSPEQHDPGPPTVVTPHDVEVDISATGIIYQSHSNCPNMPTTQQDSNGTYDGTATFQAREDTAPQQVTQHGHQYDKLGQGGALIGLEAT